MASNTVEIRLKLRDQISQAYKRVKNAVQGANRQLGTSMGRVTTASKKVKQSFDGVARSADKAKRSSIGLKAAYVAVAAFIGGRFIGAIAKAGSEVEDLTIQFKVLLGSVEAAKGRMVELEKFAQTTPFQLKEVAKASSVLEVLTKGALSTGDALRMVGDAAAITAEKDFAGLAMWVGRAYDGLQANRPVGEAMMRLQELGLVAGDARTKIEDLQKAGRGKEAWEVLQAQLLRAKGGMEEMSKTVSGLQSTIKDQLAGAVRQMLSAGLWDAFRNRLESTVKVLNEALQNQIFTRVGRAIMLMGAAVFDTWNALKSLFHVVAGGISGSVSFILKSIEKLLDGLAWLTSIGNGPVLSKELTEKIRSAADAMNDLGDASFQTMEQHAQSAGKAIVKTGKFLELMERFKKNPINADTADAAAKATKKTGASTPPGVPTEENVKQAKQIMATMQEINVAAFEAAGQMRNAEMVREVEWYNQRREFLESKNQETETLTAAHKERMEAIVQKYRDIEQKKNEKDTLKKIADAQKEARLVSSAKQQMANDIIYTLNILGQKNEAAAVAAKAAAISQTLVDTYMGAQKSYTALAGIPVVGPGLGAAAATAATVAGLARVSQIRGFADGGIVSRDQIVRVGEGNRPEAIIPLKNGAVPVRIEGQGGGTVVNNYYYGGSDKSGYEETDQERFMRFAETRDETESLQV